MIRLWKWSSYKKKEKNLAEVYDPVIVWFIKVCVRFC